MKAMRFPNRLLVSGDGMPARRRDALERRIASGLMNRVR
jgi:hypothetical protein